MSSIDAVIARARRPGGFTERKHFTLERSKAIVKMRRFALASPQFYILELVQSAIANQATYLDIQLEPLEGTFTLSYVGGGISREELGQLFDFLFASKEELRFGHLRELALGVNALLGFGPSRIIIESGDGTLEGSTRLEIHGADAVDVGSPDTPLRGTFVRAEGVAAAALVEQVVFNLEIRCLCAPIPVFVNGKPLFGYSSQRLPSLFGYARVIEFDEGDFYGVLGTDSGLAEHKVQVLTHGVWIQDAPFRGRSSRMGGVVCFDRLHKTADHAAIVQDQRWEEMWRRLEPYAFQLETGREGQDVHLVGVFGGPRLSPNDARGLLAEVSHVVVVSPGTDPDSPRGRAAVAIGAALDAPVLTVGQDEKRLFRSLFDHYMVVLEPTGSEDEIDFFVRGPDPRPAGPFLCPPVDVEPVPVSDAARVLAAVVEGRDGEDEERRESDIAWRLGYLGEIRGTVFIPADAGDAEGVRVQVRTFDRIVWEAEIPSVFPGHLLVVDVPDVSAAVMGHPLGDGTHLPELLALWMEERAVASFVEAERSALSRAQHGGIEPGTAASRLLLRVAARSVVTHLAEREGGPCLEIGTHDPELAALLGEPIVRTLAGGALSLEEIVHGMNQTAGLVYGTVPDTHPALDGLDSTRILELTHEEEASLVTLLGEASYVRVDGRDVLAEYEGVVVRDVALGLRAYPPVPLLVEGDALPGDPQARASVLTNLIEQLMDRVRDRGDGELQRHACRHLQWFALNSSSSAGEALDVDTLPLFLDAEGIPRSLASLRPYLESGIAVHHTHTTAASELGGLVLRRGGSLDDVEGTVHALVASPFVFGALRRRFPVRAALDLIDADEGAPATGGWLARQTVGTPEMRGEIGIPASAAVRPAVLVVDAETRTRYRLDSLAAEFGLLARLELGTSLDVPEYDRLRVVQQRARAVLVSYTGGLLEGTTHGTLGGTTREAVVESVLSYARRHLIFVRDAIGHVRVRITDPLARRVLGLRLFERSSGAPVSALALVRAFCAHASGGGPGTLLDAVVQGPGSPGTRDWAQDTFDAGRIQLEADPSAGAGGADPLESKTPGAMLPDTLAWNLRHWIGVLRGDGDGDTTGEVKFVDLPDLEAEIFGYHPLRVGVDHPLVKDVFERADSESLAWLLLACYAHLNEARDPITNEDEMVFQARVLDALASGELRLLEPPPDDDPSDSVASVRAGRLEW